MPEPLLITPYMLASRFMDTKEIPGIKDHPLIQWWHMLAGLGSDQPDETPWCGSFVHGVAWILYLSSPSYPARARSWLTVGHPVPLHRAERGFDIAILTRGPDPQPGPGVIAAPGHVGFFYDLNNGMIRLLGGNQGNQVSMTGFAASRILGVRRLGYA